MPNPNPTANPNPNPDSDRAPAPFGYCDHRGVAHLVHVRETPEGAWQVLDVRVIDTLIEGRDAAAALARDYATEHHHPPRPTADQRRQHDRAAA